MKWFKRIIILVVILAALGFISVGVINVDMVEEDLPTNVYDENSDLGDLINTKLFDLFLGSVTNEYTLVEEVMNLVILDSIRDNINPSYDPLSSCETTECNFIIYEDM